MILKELQKLGLPNFSAGRNSPIVTNQYLRRAGNIPTNLSGFVVPFNAKIIALSANRNGTGNAFTIEIRKNPSVTPIASISLLASESSKVDTTVSVDVNAGDILSIYMNGTAINRPEASVFFIRR